MFLFCVYEFELCLRILCTFVGAVDPECKQHLPANAFQGFSKMSWKQRLKAAKEVQSSFETRGYYESSVCRFDLEVARHSTCIPALNWSPLWIELQSQTKMMSGQSQLPMFMRQHSFDVERQEPEEDDRNDRLPPDLRRHSQ